MKAREIAQELKIGIDRIREILSQDEIGEDTNIVDFEIAILRKEIERTSKQSAYSSAEDFSAEQKEDSAAGSGPNPASTEAASDAAAGSSTKRNEHNERNQSGEDNGDAKDPDALPKEENFKLGTNQFELEPYEDFKRRIDNAPYAIILGASEVGKSCCLYIASTAMEIAANHDFAGTPRGTYRIINMHERNSVANDTRCVLVDIAGETFMSWLGMQPGGETEDYWSTVFGGKEKPKQNESNEEYFGKYLDEAHALYVLLLAPEGQDETAEVRARKAATFLLGSNIKNVAKKPVTFLAVKADRLYELRDIAYRYSGVDLRGNNGNFDLSAIGTDIDNFPVREQDQWYVSAVQNQSLGLNRLIKVNGNRDDNVGNGTRSTYFWKYAIVLHPPRSYLSYFSQFQCAKKDVSDTDKAGWRKLSQRLVNAKEEDIYRSEKEKYSAFIEDAFNVSGMLAQHKAEQDSHNAQEEEQASLDRGWRRLHIAKSLSFAAIPLGVFSFLLFNGWFDKQGYELETPKEPIRIAIYQGNKPSPYLHMNLREKIAMLADMVMTYEQDMPKLYEITSYDENSTDRNTYIEHKKAQSGCRQIGVNGNRGVADFKLLMERTSQGERYPSVPSKRALSPEIRAGQELDDCRNTVLGLWALRIEFRNSANRLGDGDTTAVVSQVKDLKAAYGAIQKADPHLLRLVNMENDRARDMPLIESILYESNMGAGANEPTASYRYLPANAVIQNVSNESTPGVTEEDPCRAFLIDGVLNDYSKDGSLKCVKYMRFASWLNDKGTPINTTEDLFRKLPYVQQVEYCEQATNGCKPTLDRWNFERNSAGKISVIVILSLFTFLSFLLLLRRDGGTHARDHGQSWLRHIVLLIGRR